MGFFKVTCTLAQILMHFPIFIHTNQRTNGPVNAHLRSAVYTNVIENSPSIGQMKPLGHFFFFFRIINIK